MINIDFEDPRFKSLVRTIQYIFLSVFVIAGTVLLVYAGQGYDINRDTGEVIQNGLVLINSSPEDAVVTIDDKAEEDTTPGRFPLPEGEYAISLALDGYRPWSKSITVVGSSVEWLYYPLLVPTELNTNHVTAFKGLEFIGQGNDKSKFLVRRTQLEPIFSLITINDNVLTDEVSITLAEDLLTLVDEKIGRFDFTGWANDSRHTILTHSNGNTTEYIWLDTETVSESKNLNKVFGLALEDVRFIDGDPQQLYALVDGNLRALDLADETISAPIVSGVNSYILFKDKFIIYLNRTEDSAVELGLIDGDNEPVVIKKLTGKISQYEIEFAEFDSTFHLALLDTQNGRLSVYVDPHKHQDQTVEPQKLSFALEGAKYIDFSNNGQFLEAQSGNSFVVYDFEHERTYRYKIGFEISPDYQATWMDGFRLLAHDKSGVLNIFEFDGKNSHKLIITNQNYDVMFDSDYESMYTFTPGKSTDSLFLESTSFLVDKEN